MNAEARQYARVISTKEELEELVRQALVSGVLNLENCQVKVEFNLAELLQRTKRIQGRTQNLNKKDEWWDERPSHTITCPFQLSIGNCYFKKGFVAYGKDIGIVFEQNVRFTHVIFNACTSFKYAVFQGKVFFQWILFPTEREAYFKGAEFENTVYFKSCNFRSIANFTECLFHGEVNSFQSTFFQQHALFAETTFKGKASFNKLILTHGIDLDDSTFEQEANFLSTQFGKGNRSSFCRTIFKHGVNFNLSIFGDSETNHRFDKTRFEDKADFNCVHFLSSIDFGKAIFKQHTSFKNVMLYNNSILSFDHITTHENFEIVPASLQGVINMTSPTFESDKSLVTLDFENCCTDLKGLVLFKGLKIYKEGIHLTILNLKKDSNAKEDSNVKVNFKNCGFYGKNVAFTNVDMQQVFVEGGNDISGMAFYRCQWEQDYPELWFNRCGWLAFRAFKGLDLEANTQKIADAYAQLKVRALEAGDAQLSNDFHFWHQFYQRQKKLWNPFYLCTSAYGLSACLPSFWFGVAFLVFSLIYMWNLHCFTESNLVSLSASVPFVFNDVEVIKDKVELIATQEHGWFYPLYILQHLVQGYLLFQIGAAIRNKVKR